MTEGEDAGEDAGGGEAQGTAACGWNIGRTSCTRPRWMSSSRGRREEDWSGRGTGSTPGLGETVSPNAPWPIRTGDGGQILIFRVPPVCACAFNKSPSSSSIFHSFSQSKYSKCRVCHATGAYLTDCYMKKGGKSRCVPSHNVLETENPFINRIRKDFPLWRFIARRFSVRRRPLDAAPAHQRFGNDMMLANKTLNP